MSDFEDALRYAIWAAIENARPKPKFKFRTAEEFSKNKFDFRTMTLWTKTKPDTTTPKFAKVKQLLIDSAEDIKPVKVKIWYQVYKPGKTFGLGVVDGVITDHPERQFEGYKFDLSKANFETVKICEQILP